MHLQTTTPVDAQDRNAWYSGGAGAIGQVRLMRGETVRHKHIETTCAYNRVGGRRVRAQFYTPAVSAAAFPCVLDRYAQVQSTFDCLSRQSAD